MENVTMTGCICNSPNLKRLKELKDEMDSCKVYCETGVLYGGTIILQMMSSTPCHFIGLDLFTGYYGNSYDPHRKIDLTDHLEIVKDNINKNNPHNHSYELIKGDSTDKKISNAVKQEIDYMFIDGDHSSQGVWGDFINFKDKVRKGGIIVFDNYNDPSWTQVKPMVDKICESYKNEFMIKEKFGHCLVLKKY
jgi:hypothetical protein|tara:strand:- start:82 stop:660 length:579 start_codon:yes stop_codon:yes gene_type:complete